MGYVAAVTMMAMTWTMMTLIRLSLACSGVLDLPAQARSQSSESHVKHGLGISRVRLIRYYYDIIL